MSLSIVKKILEEVEGASSEIVNLTSKLVQFPTVSPPGNTKECVDFIKSYMDNAGIETTIYERREGKSNICARIRGGSDSAVLWLGHLDVVPEGSFSKWAHNPYGGEVVGHRVYGRGASDDKGSCASAMVAANILSGVNKNQRCTAEFWFTCDEEVGAVDGVRWLAEERKFHGDVCIIGDGYAIDSPSEKTYIGLGCKGFLRTRLRASGKTAHGSLPFMGENAIHKLIAAIKHVKKIEDLPLDVSWELEPIIKSSIKSLLEESVLTKSQMASLKRLFHYPTASLNLISGGVKENIVPDKAEATFDIRIAPGVDIKKVEDRMHKLIEDSHIKGVKVETECQDGYYEKPSSEFVDQLKKTVEIATGAVPTLKIETGGTDGMFVKQITGIPCLGFGAGLRGMAHTPDEYVTTKNLVMAAKVYCIFPIIWQMRN